MPTEIVNVDVDALGRLLLAIEAYDHKRGWDNLAPALYVLHRETDSAAVGVLLGGFGPRVRSGGYAASHLVARHTFDRTGGDPTVALFRLAVRCDRDRGHPVQAMLRHHVGSHLLGLAFVTEGYGILGTPERLMQAQAEQRAGKKIPDMPDAVELRQVTAVDVAGTGYHLRRIRGQDPACAHGPILKHGQDPPADQENSLRGTGEPAEAGQP